MRNEKELKGIKTERKRKDVSDILHFSSKMTAKRPKTTAKMGHPAIGRGIHSSEIP